MSIRGLDFFNDNADWYDLIYCKKDYEAAACFLEDVFRRHGKVKDVLDVGCGTGTHAKYLVRKGYSLTCMDKSASMLKVAKAKVPQAEFIEDDMMEFKTMKKFDAALCLFNVINYTHSLSGLTRLFMKISKVLRRGGLLIVDNVATRKGLKNEKPAHYLNKNGQRSVSCIIRPQEVKGSDFKLNIFITKKRGAETDTAVYDDIVITTFSTADIKKAMKRAGFSCRLYEHYRMKNYSRLKRHREQPVFVGTKNGR